MAPCLKQQSTRAPPPNREYPGGRVTWMFWMFRFGAVYVTTVVDRPFSWRKRVRMPMAYAWT